MDQRESLKGNFLNTQNQLKWKTKHQTIWDAAKGELREIHSTKYIRNEVSS